MLVRITPHRIGYYTARPVSQRWAKRFSKHIAEMGGRRTAEAFFQSDCELPEEITHHRDYKELGKGWDLTIRVDPWEYGHWLGYDAYTVAER